MSEQKLMVVDHQRDLIKRLEDPEVVQLIKDTYARGATDLEFRLAMETAKHLGLDPVAKQIYFVKRWDSQLRREVMATQISIDGMRLVAERSGKYGGQTEPLYCGRDGKWLDIWLQDEPPVAAKVGVIRTDFKEPVFATARYSTYVQRKKNGDPNSFWDKMPDLMLAKAAETLAIRKAFPREISAVAGLGDPSEEEPRVPQAESIRPAVAEAQKPGDTVARLASFVDKLERVGSLAELAELRSTAAALPEEHKPKARELWKAKEQELNRAMVVDAEFADEQNEPPHDPETGEVAPDADTLPMFDDGGEVEF